MPRNFTRKIIDAQGNFWCVEIPPDVDPESIVEVLSASHDGIVKLQGYKLVSDKEYKLPADNSEITNGAKTFNFYKKMTTEGISKEDFSDAMQALIERARESKIGKVKVTTFDGKKIQQDERGPYIDWELPCHICSKPIQGLKRLSMSDGVYTRAQMFTPYDKGVVQYRPGSKLRVCGDCAPKQLTPQEAGLPFPPSAEIEIASETNEGTPKIDFKVESKATPKVKDKDPLDELLEFAKPNSDIDPVFIKGMVYGLLKGRKTNQ